VAPHRWIERARLIGPAIPGVSHFDSGGLKPAERNRLRMMIRALEELSVEFIPGSHHLELGAEPTVAAMAGLGSELARIAAAIGQRVCIEVVGDADSSGAAPAHNLELASSRARAVESGLRRQLERAAGEEMQSIELRWRARSPGAGGAHYRRARLRVGVADAGAAACEERG
jgi:hypothetical protein